MIKIFTLVVTPFGQNCRVLLNTETEELMIVDPGGEVPRIVSFFGSKGFLDSRYHFKKILLTHSHIDHGGGVADCLEFIQKELSQEVDLLFHKDNDLYRNTISTIASKYGLSESEYKNVPAATGYLDDEEVVQFGSYELRALFTPGHAPGHLAFFIANAEVVEEVLDNGFVTSRQTFEGPLLLAGDTLFDGSIGRTDLPGGDHQELLDSIANKLLVLPDETLVLSGHGSNTTIEKERNTNPFLQSL